MIDFKLNFCYEGENQSALQDVKGAVLPGNVLFCVGTAVVEKPHCCAV